jgi:DNA-binding NarL/FixJ family response regulator
MQIILADNQVIYRTGIARILMTEPAIRVVAQCADMQRLHEAVGGQPRSVVIFPSSITEELHDLLDEIQRAGSRSVMILEQGVMLDESVAKRLEGVILRSVAGPQLVDCLYRVASGERYVQRAVVKTMPSPDNVGERAIRRLTPKELQIIALISEGCKNKEIANQLGTKEQVVKNYLRSIYVKTGVSDRLELALFTLHHQALAAVVEAARLTLVRTA